MILKKILFILLLCPWIAAAQLPGVTDTLPQGTDEQLAAQYMQSKEYEKAAYYYEKLFDKKPIDYYYNNLLVALLESGEHSKAEKLVKRQIKRSPLALSYQVDQGYVYKFAGDESKANKTWRESIDNLSASAQQINELASAFINRKESELALETYQKGRKLLKNQYGFNFEIGGLLGGKGDFQGMITEYLDVLEVSEAYMQQVQNYLVRELMRYEGDTFRGILQQELLRRTQKSPDKTMYYELLIWNYMQQKAFGPALIHAKALDKRQKEDGGRVYSLSRLAAEVKDYDAAIKGYQYLLEKGKNGYYYIPSRIEMLQVMTKKVTSHGKYTDADLLGLELQYDQTLQELGKKGATAPLMRDQAHLYAFYLDQPDKAVTILEELISLPGVRETLIAEAKLELGDILLMLGDIWEASLLYSQVDKTFKHDPIGDEAKLRNARLSYYTGDFNWAQAQLDVLKGSTSKLIANDAMQLSLVISDNSTIDTNLVPLSMFARAELLSYRNQDDDALSTLDSINNYFPGHALADDILFRKARIMEKRQDFEEAAEFYKKIMDGFGFDILGDDAMFRLAEIYDQVLNDTDKASDLYRRLLMEHPGSLYVVEARRRFRELRGDFVN